MANAWKDNITKHIHCIGHGSNDCLFISQQLENAINRRDGPTSAVCAINCCCFFLKKSDIFWFNPPAVAVVV